jgi:hypothetical protein
MYSLPMLCISSPAHFMPLLASHFPMLTCARFNIFVIFVSGVHCYGSCIRSAFHHGFILPVTNLDGFSTGLEYFWFLQCRMLKMLHTTGKKDCFSRTETYGLPAKRKTHNFEVYYLSQFLRYKILGASLCLNNCGTHCTMTGVNIVCLFIIVKHIRILIHV